MTKKNCININNTFGLERTCPALDDIKNGFTSNLQESYEVGAVIKFICLDGYSLSGNGTITCTKDGWTDTQPTCVGKSYFSITSCYT